jgi:adenylylsulfate kinase
MEGKGEGLTVWFTGLSGAGKTTLCNAVYSILLDQGHRVEILDGDALRQHLSRDLGFSKEDRDENIRRIGFIADMLTRNGILVLVAAISPYRTVRDTVRQKIGRFIEVFVDAPLSVCEERDPKGLYRRARCGELRGFTGIDDPYEAPLLPDVRCRTDQESLEMSSQKVISAVADYLGSKKKISP